jgi:hypothetical protein
MPTNNTNTIPLLKLGDWPLDPRTPLSHGQKQLQAASRCLKNFPDLTTVEPDPVDKPGIR